MCFLFCTQMAFEKPRESDKIKATSNPSLSHISELKCMPMETSFFSSSYFVFLLQTVTQTVKTVSGRKKKSFLCFHPSSFALIS